MSHNKAGENRKKRLRRNSKHLKQLKNLQRRGFPTPRLDPQVSMSFVTSEGDLPCVSIISPTE